MIDAERYSVIRRLFFAEHWKVGTIATELGLHHDVVERVIECDRFSRAARRVPASIIEPYRDFIERTLEKHPRLRATRLFEMLRVRGFPGSVSQVRRYVRPLRPQTSVEAFLRLRTMPGEQGQVDWGHFGKIPIGSARRSLSCFVMVLSSSRGMYARFALDQTLESFLLGHVLAFEALGGVPRTLLYDNLKSVVLERQGQHVRFHPHLLEFAGHYHYEPKPCAPYRGNEKGKVERTIQYLRHSFFAARTFRDVADLNAQLATWIEEVAHARAVPGHPDKPRVRDALAEERARLLPLPEHPFSCRVVRPVRSGKQPYVRFDLNDYSIPSAYVRKPLTLIASEAEVRIVDGGDTEIARHARSWDRAAIIEDAAHLAELARRKRQARDLRGRDYLRSVTQHADGFIEALARRGEPLGAAVVRLARLVDAYGAQDVDVALREALEREAFSVVSVAHILDRRRRARKQQPFIPTVLPDDPRVRDLRVAPHALGPYDALSHDDSEDQT